MRGLQNNYFLLTCVAVLLGISEANKIIESPRWTNWGDWGSWQRCPFGRYAQAVQLKTEPYQGVFYDDTAANAIRLFCGNPANSSTSYITSSEGSWGSWGKVFTCRSDGRPMPPDGIITGFQLRVEGPITGDDTATNNLRVNCNYPGLGIADQILEADGLTYGGWSDAQKCNSYQAICAIQTQVEPYQGENTDDTALNNVAMECCDR